MARLARNLQSAALLIGLVTAPASLGAQSMHPAARPSAAEVRARVDSLARAFIANYGAPGVSVQVVSHGDTVVRAGYGLADVSGKVPATAATVYRIGSITKQFTSSAVMRLVEQKKVALDDSIGRYLPTLPAAWRVVTVRQLLNHTSGIPSYTDIGPRWQRRWGEAMTPDTLVALTAGDAMWFAPGSSWRYDNTGYVILGMLLNRVTGTPYPKYVEEKLVRPLGLQHTWYCDTVRVIPNRARGYQRMGAQWADAPFLDMSQPYSAGALCSTIGDVARWDALLSSGRVVKPESWKLMTSPQGAAEKGAYGFGLMVDRLDGHLLVTHSGGIHGFTSDNAIFPADSLTVTVLTNTSGRGPGAFMRNIARAALGLPLPQEAQRVTLSAAERARYVGHYMIQLPDGSKLAFAVTSGATGLISQATGQMPIELIAYGNHVFGAAFDPALRITFKVDGDKATGFTLFQGGATMDAPRVSD